MSNLHNPFNDIGTLQALHRMEPPLHSRAWMSAPHPRLPIIATAAADKTVRLYSLKTFQQVGSITGGHKRSIRTCAWKPTSCVGGQASQLATGSFDASVGIWKRSEPQVEDEMGRLQKQKQQAGESSSDLSVRSDDEEDDDDEWQYAVMLDGHESEIKGVSWSASGQYLATCSRDKSVWIWEDMSFENGGGDDGFDEEDNFETVAVLQEHDGDIKTVNWHPCEDLLASGSYDDSIKLYREDLDDWVCVSTIAGHSGTVWGLDWEAEHNTTASRLSKYIQPGSLLHQSVTDDDRSAFLSELKRSGPRLVSCSDDQTIRIWQRQPRLNSSRQSAVGNTFPSIIRTHSVDEDWFESARLPSIHTRPIYSVAWSRRTGLIASTGSDGMIVVYAERWTTASSNPHQDSTNGSRDAHPVVLPTEWTIVARIYDAHDVFEINHIIWACRKDQDAEEGEEVLLTTGDDGQVRVWRIIISDHTLAPAE